MLMPFTYIIRPVSYDVLKIGSTTDLENRLRNIQVCHWDVVYVAGILKGGFELEFKLHTLFRPYCLRSEWFSNADEIMRLIFDLPADEPKPYGIHRLLVWEGNCNELIDAIQRAMQKPHTTHA